MPNGLLSAQAERLESLCRKRDAIKEMIKEERKHPAMDAQKIYSFKKQNLELKDEIEVLRRVS